MLQAAGLLVIKSVKMSFIRNSMRGKYQILGNLINLVYYISWANLSFTFKTNK